MSMKAIEIDGSFTIERVGDIQEILRAALAHHSGSRVVEINLNGVTELDGAGFQLLLAFAHAVEKTGTHLELQQIPEHIQTVLDRYDVTSRFTHKESA